MQPEFRTISQALFNLRAEEKMKLGQHLRFQEDFSERGSKINQVYFEPGIPISSIDPLSEDIYGLPKANKVLPYSNLLVKLIVDLQDVNVPETLSFLRSFNNVKREASHNFLESLQNATLMSDSSEVVVFDDSLVKTPKIVSSSRKIHASSSKQKALIIARESQAAGLSFLVSDFNNLDVEDFPIIRPFRTIAVKFNHPLERELPANIGRVSLGELVECNTNNKKELKKTNEELESRHQTTVKRLHQLGMLPVSLVIKDNIFGFDVADADRQISKRLESLR